MAGLAGMQISGAFNMSKIASAILGGILGHTIPCECIECGSPVKYYGFKFKPHPDMAVIRYTCGSERTVHIRFDDEGSDRAVIYEVTKYGMCSTQEPEDVI